MNGHYSITANFAPETSENLEIRTWYDLDAVRDNLAGNHTLMNDLDSTTAGYEELASPTANGGKGWQPIGYLGTCQPIGYFGTCSSGSDPRIADARWIGLTGTFDGQGYEIRDLCINRPGEGHVGLFGSVDGGGIIKNVGVVNVTVTGSNHVGVLTGVNFYGTVSNSYSTGSVTGNRHVGGLVGENTGTVSNCYSTGCITGDERVGGLVGLNFNFGNVSNSHYNYDEVLINGENLITVGALSDEDFEEWLANDKFLDINDRLSQENGYYVVNNVADFKELLAFGQNASLKFSLKDDIDLGDDPNFYIPYLAGEFDGNGHKISNLSFDFDFVSPVGLFGCLASGEKVTDLGVENVNVTGAGFVGGLAGLNWGSTVSNSYATGNVSGNSEIMLYEDVGGLIGQNFGAVSNSYFSGNVNGDNYVGGLVGKNGGNMSNSYSTGSVTGTWHTVGGLVGINLAVTVSNSYSTASVTGDGNVGGLVGSSGYFSTVSNSYSTGSVTGNERVGGLVGVGQGGTVSNCFWDTETSGQDTSDGGMGKTTAEMQDIATFSGAGWDIIGVANPSIRNLSYIWNIVDDETYPFLSWQPV
jgi:hypothetical protein